MTDRAPFEPRGKVSLIEACIDMIRKVEPKDGTTYAQAVQDIREATGLDDVERADIMGPMNAASKALRKLGEPGMQNRRGIGWQRETPDAMVDAGERHERKARRQVRWAVEAVDKVEIEALSWEARGRRDGVLERHRRQAEITAKRGRRLRPLPAASGE